MKKMFGTSLIAIMMATPMLANAAVGDRTVTVINATAPVEASSTLATTTYVQGAYVAAADKIDALIVDTAAAEGQYVKSGKTVAANLDALDDQVKANAGNIETLMAGEAVNGSIANQIKTAVDAVDAGTLSSDISDNTQAINGINAKQIKYLDTWGSTEEQSVTIANLPDAD